MITPETLLYSRRPSAWLGRAVLHLERTPDVNPLHAVATLIAALRRVLGTP